MNQPFDYTTQNFNPQQEKPTYVTYIPYGFTPKTYEERMKIKKLGNVIGISLLALTLFAAIINYLQNVLFVGRAQFPYLHFMTDTL